MVLVSFGWWSRASSRSQASRSQAIRSLVGFDGTVFRDLHRPAEAVQDVRGAAQRVPDVEQPGDQVRQPSEGPALIVAEPVHGGAFIQCVLQAR
jgi:hypothetical protein